MPKLRQILWACVKTLIISLLKHHLWLSKYNKHPICTHVGLNDQALEMVVNLAYPFLNQNCQAFLLKLPYTQEIIHEFWNIVYLEHNMIDPI
jgi:hypothetical protein